MAENPKVALVFLWKELERRVRIRKNWWKISRKNLNLIFNQDRRTARSEHGSPQSQVIPDRKFLEENVNKISDQFEK